MEGNNISHINQERDKALGYEFDNWKTIISLYHDYFINRKFSFIVCEWESMWILTNDDEYCLKHPFLVPYECFWRAMVKKQNAEYLKNNPQEFFKGDLIFYDVIWDKHVSARNVVGYIKYATFNINNVDERWEYQVINKIGESYKSGVKTVFLRHVRQLLIEKHNKHKHIEER